MVKFQGFKFQGIKYQAPNFKRACILFSIFNIWDLEFIFWNLFFGIWDFKIMSFAKLVFKGIPVHYSISGQGFPIILLHGFNENLHVWDSILPVISKNYQCICIDLPGFGKSPLPSSLTIKYMADSVHRVIEELALIKPIVIGHSMGGYVVLELVNHYPDALSGAGLIHSTALSDSDEKKENRKKSLDFLDKNSVDVFFKVFIQGLFAPQNLKSNYLKRAETIICQTNKNSVVAGIKAIMERPDRTEVLKQSILPWLLVAGQFDELIPLGNITMQASYCQKALIEILYNSGHLGMIEEPEKSSEIILKFAEWIGWKV